MPSVNAEISWLRTAVKNMRRQADNCVFGSESISAEILRHAAILIDRSTTLAEEYEAERIIREEKSNAR